LSLFKKILVVLLVLTGASVISAAETGDLRVPLSIKSRFVVRASEGPPIDMRGLNRYAPGYIFKFTALQYSRGYYFSDKGRFVQIRDFYGTYELPSFQTLSMDRYFEGRRQFAVSSSWRNDLKQQLGKGNAEQGKEGVQIEIPVDAPQIVQSFIGEGRSNIKVSGSRSISFSGRSEWDDDIKSTPTYRQSKFPTLQMEQISRFKVTGTIGSKITVEVDQDSKRDVELANTIKLRYKGDDDEILQSIEAGNTTLSLPNAQMIGYSQNVQGLFGIKATAKIGNLDLTAITSQEKGTSEKANFSAGTRGTEDTLKDYQYLPNVYFWLRDPSEYDPADTIVSVELYQSAQGTGSWPTNPRGLACVTPADSLPFVSPEEMDRTEYEIAPFAPIDPTQFIVYRNSWFVVLNQAVSQGAALGAYMVYTHYTPGVGRDTVRVGNLGYRPNNSNRDADTTFVLKLLKARAPTFEFSTWTLMWRNVYDLGARNLSSDGFELKIYKGQGVRATDLEDEGGRCYITLLGLDRKNNNTQQPGPDCIFDFDNTMIDASRGHLIFPRQQPFISESLTVTVPSIYRRDQGNLHDSSVYYIYVKSAQRASTFPLGRANIMASSEVVRLGDGTVLRRDVDYTINYDLGQITFLSEQALNPAANVSVDFEYAPFFMPEKKSLFGVAAQYRLFDNSNISMAAMYRSESASDPRPRVGREPKRGFVWDSNFNFSFKPEFMTGLVDALPLVEADAPSGIDITGEVAQSFPNPNIKNEAFIDDFEGSKNYTDLSTRRGIWTAASPPLDSAGNKIPLTRRANLWWYNPVDPLAITDIWPGRQDNVRSQDNRIDVMILNYYPDTTSVAPESSWAGIMRPLYTGLSNQTLSKYIEVWYYPDTFSIAGNPTLNIDLGAISEDIDDDQSLDSEDRDSLGTAIGVFEPNEEDTGLDGVFNAQETGPYPPPDRDGDDWFWNPDTRGQVDYSRINGTEGNNNDPDRLGRMDTEDINNNSSLDMPNGYFHYQTSLNNPAYIADATTTGWKLLRIPLQDSTIYRVRGNGQQADFTRINYARIWINGAAESYQLAIATIELVGNKWQELPIEPREQVGPDEKFEVAIKNTHDNAGTYYPPPGIAGNLDRETGIREKEQSLVLTYQNMAPGHIAGAAWTLFNQENYTQYGRLKMFVHGDTTTASGVPDSMVTFFITLNVDNNNFYEYRVVLDTGWVHSNWVEIDFAKLTDLKYWFLRNGTLDSTRADTTSGHYRVYGRPSLSQVKFFIVGVEISPDAPQAYNGEVWIDEMRVVDVRRNPDFAGRIQATARFSDFMDLNVSYTRQGADFFPLSAKTALGSTNISRSARFNIRTDKFLSPSLGLSLPVSVTWQSTLSLPRLQPGSDIILDETAQQSEKSESKTYGYTVTESFNRNTKNWLWNLTLNRIRTSYTFSHAQASSPVTPIDRRDVYRGSAAYDLSPKAKPSFKPLFWTKFLFLPKSIHSASMTPLPTQLGFSGEVNGSKSQSVNQRGIWTSTRIRDLSLTGNTSISFFPSLRTTYNATTARDISRPGRFRLSINPSKLKLGQEQTFQQRFETSYQPRLLKFVENRFTFNSQYIENSDLRRNPDSTRSTQMNSAFKTDLTFNIQNLFPRRDGGARPPARPDTPGKIPDGSGQSDDEKMPDMKGEGLQEQQGEDQPDKPEGGGGPGMGSPRWMFGKFSSLLRSIKPVRASYLRDKKFTVQGLLERPSWEYLFGFTERPDARSKSTTGLVTPNQTVFSDNYQVESGLQPGRGLDISTGYNLRKTTTRSTNNPVMSRSVTFPDISVTLAQLEKLFVFKKLSNNVSLQSNYSKKIDENGDAGTGELYKRDTAREWAPLLSLNVNFVNNVRATIRYDMGKIFTQNLRSVGQARRDNETLRNSLKLSLQYSLTAPKGLKLPLLKRVKFNSQLSLNLDITLATNKTQSFTEGAKSVDAHKSQITVEPRMTYQFSRAITGSIRARWDDSDDKILKRKHHIREIGISAEIRF
jgi:hypothetical protein